MAVVAMTLLLPAVAPVGTAAQELPEQKVHRDGFEPVSDEVFSVVEQFYDLDRDWPLEARIIEEWEEEKARYEELVFTTQSGERVPGYLVRPLNGTGPFPCVLLIHGLGSSRERWWEEDRESLPLELLDAGIAVFAIDLRFHGERSAENDYQNPVFLTMGNNFETRARDMIIQSTIDGRRALQYLDLREEIDGERVAVMGYSMGGMIALYLPVLEPRLVAAVASAVPTTEARGAPTDHFNFAPQIGVPVLLQIGRQDWLSSPADAKRLRGLIPTEESELVFYESGHRLPSSFATDAATWLKEKLLQAPQDSTER